MKALRFEIVICTRLSLFLPGPPPHAASPAGETTRWGQSAPSGLRYRIPTTPSGGNTELGRPQRLCRRSTHQTPAQRSMRQNQSAHVPPGANCAVAVSGTNTNTTISRTTPVWRPGSWLRASPNPSPRTRHAFPHRRPMPPNPLIRGHCLWTICVHEPSRPCD